MTTCASGSQSCKQEAEFLGVVLLIILWGRSIPVWLLRIANGFTVSMTGFDIHPPGAPSCSFQNTCTVLILWRSAILSISLCGYAPRSA